MNIREVDIIWLCYATLRVTHELLFYLYVFHVIHITCPSPSGVVSALFSQDRRSDEA